MEQQIFTNQGKAPLCPPPIAVRHLCVCVLYPDRSDFAVCLSSPEISLQVHTFTANRPLFALCSLLLQISKRGCTSGNMEQVGNKYLWPDFFRCCSLLMLVVKHDSLYTTLQKFTTIIMSNLS